MFLNVDTSTYGYMFINVDTLTCSFVFPCVRTATYGQIFLKGTVAPDIFILFMMSIIKSVLFVWPLISLIFFYSFINFIFVNKVLIYILPITLELAHISLESLANLASAFSKSQEHCQRVF